MSVRIIFQSPDWNADRNERVLGNPQDEGVSVTVEGFDFDHQVVTVYPAGEDPDINLTLATRVEWMNESGEECGQIGWMIYPEPLLVAKMPELAQHVGKRYGRILVFSESDALVDDIRRIASETDRPSHARLARIQNRLDDAGLPTPIPAGDR